MTQIMTGKKKLSWFRTILLLFTVISFWNITGCSGNYSIDKNSEYTGFNSNTLIFKDSIDISKLERKNSIYFRQAINTDSYKIFVSDFLGNSKKEIIFTSGRNLLIYSMEGKLLLEKYFDQDYKPSFIADFDNDGKSDLIMGTRDLPRNEIVVINGVGNVISGFKEDKSSQDFSSIIPVGIYKNNLFAIARPAGADSSKGILCFNSFSMDLLYTFYTPDPVNISLVGAETANPVMVPSYETHNDGVFRKYAREQDLRINEDYEKDGVYLKIGLNGSPLDEKTILVRDKNGLGTIDFSVIPENEKQIILFHHTIKTNSTKRFFHILVIDVETGTIVSSSIKEKGEFLDKRIIPIENDFLILTASKDNHKFYIDLFSSDLELIKTLSVTARPVFKQIAVNADKDDFLLYSIIKGSIYSLTRDLELNKTISGKDYINMELFSINNQTGLILMKKNGFEIYSVD